MKFWKAQLFDEGKIICLNQYIYMHQKYKLKIKKKQKTFAERNRSNKANA